MTNEVTTETETGNVPAKKAEISAVHPVPISEKYTSPTVTMLKGKDRPQDECVCTHCVWAVWYTTPRQVKNYCGVMRLIVWDKSNPIPITRCDQFCDTKPEA